MLYPENVVIYEKSEKYTAKDGTLVNSADNTNKQANIVAINAK